MTRGAKHVFIFTLQQMAKSRANRITLIILLLAAAAAVPVGGIFLSDEGAEPANVYVNVSTMEDYLAGETLGFDARYGIQYGYSIVILIVCVFSTTFIVRAIVEEKASRLVETLMVSSHPLSLVLGKISAVMVFIFGELILTAGAAGLSYGICGKFLDVSYIGKMLESVGITPETLHLGLDTAIVLVISMIMACFLFSLLAGLAGAGCASMDEIEGANMAAMGAVLVGYLVSCIGFAVTDGPFLLVMALCPVVSAFTAPVYFVFGDIGWGTIALSLGIETVLIVLLLLLAAKVYDQLILYKGSRMKFAGILSMAVSGRKGGRKK